MAPAMAQTLFYDNFTGKPSKTAAIDGQPQRLVSWRFTSIVWFLPYT
jgi:hypothetical protein